MKASKSEKGQSLIEIIVALALASLVAVGLVRVTTTSIKGSRYSSDQSRMTALAQKKIGTIVEYKNSHSNDFWGGSYYPGGFIQQDDTSGDYCLYTTVSDATTTLGLPAPAKMAKINVKAFWDEKAGVGTQCASKNYNYSLSFDTYVTN